MPEEPTKRKRTTAPGRSATTAKAAADARAAHAEEALSKTVEKLRENAKQRESEESLLKRLTSIPGAVADSALRMVVKTTDVPLRVGKALFLKPEQAEMMKQAGATLKDLREVAGLTRDELSEALDLKDHSLIEAVENGTAILSFELILRLSALLARHDPVPLMLSFTRSYNPELWKMLEDWGVGRLSLQFERERHFINIYRRHDAARRLSDESFARVLEFTRSAFDTALHFAAELEHVEDRIHEVPESPEAGPARQR